MNVACHDKAGIAAIAGLLGALFGSGALAAPVTVINPGFEDISGEVAQNEFTFGALNGWDLYDPQGVAGLGTGGDYFIGTLTPQPDPGSPGDFINFTHGAPEGSRVGIAFAFAGNDVGNGGGEYGFEQTLAATLAANTRYELSVGIGNIASGDSLASGFFNLDGFPGYRVDLLAGGEVIASDHNTLAGSIPEGEFRLSTVTFTTGASHARLGEALGIRLVNLNVLDPAFPAADLEVDFDDVRLSAVVVPLPAMAPVMALLVAGAVAVRRR
jgi:hypothetical protein